MEETILLIEDDVEISEMVAHHLTTEGMRVVQVYDGSKAIEAFGQAAFDLVLLDLMLPGRSGMDVLQHIRSGSTVPVLIMSAKSGDVDKAVGLGLGADDYVAKPFSMIELTARVRAAIRRSTQYAAVGAAEKEKTSYTVGDLQVDIDNFTVVKHGNEIKLTAKEFDILKLFVRNPTRVFTKAQLYRSVWGDEYYGDENVINVHIRRLREKIEDDPANPVYIKTLWGIGYKLGGRQE